MDNQYEKLTKEIHDSFSANNFDRCLQLADKNVRVVAHALGVTLPALVAAKRWQR